MTTPASQTDAVALLISQAIFEHRDDPTCCAADVAEKYARQIKVLSAPLPAPQVPAGQELREKVANRLDLNGDDPYPVSARSGDQILTRVVPQADLEAILSTLQSATREVVTAPLAPHSASV